MSAVVVSPDVMVMGLLQAGQRAVVETVLGASAQVHRLREMGLRDGAEVQMIQPGSPCLIRLGEQRIGFRANDLMSVLVRPEGPA
jgi:Fe2+ transport system protein FeoA